MTRLQACSSQKVNFGLMVMLTRLVRTVGRSDLVSTPVFTDELTVNYKSVFDHYSLNECIPNLAQSTDTITSAQQLFRLRREEQVASLWQCW